METAFAVNGSWRCVEQTEVVTHVWSPSQAPPAGEAWSSVQAWAKAVNKSNELTTDIRMHRFVPTLEKTNATMQNPLHDFQVWLLPNASLSHPLRGGEKRMREMHARRCQFSSPEPPSLLTVRGPGVYPPRGRVPVDVPPGFYPVLVSIPFSKVLSLPSGGQSLRHMATQG